MLLKYKLFIALIIYCGLAFAERPVPKDIINPNAKNIYDIAVIGSGAGGSMAALRGVLNNDMVLWATGARASYKQARGYWVPEISSIPMFDGVYRPIIAMRDSVLKQISTSNFKEKLHVLPDLISSVKKDENGLFILKSKKKGEFKAKNIILATGTMDVQPTINNSIRDILKPANKQQVSYCVRCDGHLALGKKNVVIIGATTNTAEIATLIVERYSPEKVTILTHGEKEAFDPEQKSLLGKYNVEILNSKIDRIIKRGRKLTGFSLAGKKQIPSDFVIVNLGMRINNQLAKDLKANLDAKGYVIGDESGLTSVPGLYVVGDLKSNTRKQVYTAWDQASRAAEAINANLRMKKRKALLEPAKIISYQKTS